MIGSLWGNVGWIAFDAKQEVGTDEHGTQCRLDPRFETVVIPRRAVKLQRVFEIIIIHGTPIRPPHQRGQDSASALVFFLSTCRITDENPPAAGRLARSLGIVGSGDRDLVK